MKRNKVKHTLAEGGVAIGTMMFEFPTDGIARLAASAGAEFAMFDMEHTGWSIETIRRLMATSRPTDLVPMVRVPATQYHFIARVLDVGAMAIMVPMVHTAEQARMIQQSAHYPPVGQRGAAFMIAHDDYAEGEVTAKIERSNEEILTICQIESVQGLENVDAIAAVEGVDMLWVGNFDLSISMGIPGQFEHPRFLRALERTVEACQRHGKTAANLATDPDEGAQRLKEGFRCLAYGGDLWLYRTALRAGIEQIRSSVWRR
ncbi:MAG: aldolase [Candidatus Latescibacteria bacterium]|nr:aldolase [Candidatus Latescibacterota bacterium]